jgi:hypothetical protein
VSKDSNSATIIRPANVTRLSNLIENDRHGGGVLSFYADESGSMGRGQGDLVALLAIGFHDDNWTLLKDSTNSLKRRYFPNWNLDDIEIKSVYLRRSSQTDQTWPPNAFATLDARQMARFGHELYELIDAAPFEWAAAACSKTHLRNHYGITKPRDVFFRMYTRLLERLHGWADCENTYGRLFLDQQHQGLVNTRHDEIIAQHRTLLQQGTPLQSVDRIIEQPFFMESDSSVHIQLADVLAYNVLRQVRDGFERPYRFYQRILPKCRGFSTWHKGPAPYGLTVEP